MIARTDAIGESGRLPFPPVMLAVAGASGSGKTTLAAELARTLGGLHFPLDTYYHDLGHLPLEERALQNFDDPAMIDVPLLASHLQTLSQGHRIERPLYQFSVYVDTADDVCFARRLKRDVGERGRDPESVRRQYDATVRPCGLAFVRPLIDFADLVVDGTDPLDFKVELVMNSLKKRGLRGKPGAALDTDAGMTPEVIQ